MFSPPWEGPVERTYARTVFIDGLRYANTRSKSLTLEKGRTFTEGEVKAILEGMCVVPRFIGKSQLARDLEKSLRAVAEQSGIVLDSA